VSVSFRHHPRRTVHRTAHHKDYGALLATTTKKTRACRAFHTQQDNRNANLFVHCALVVGAHRPTRTAHARWRDLVCVVVCILRIFYLNAVDLHLSELWLPGLGCEREMFSMICECSLHANGSQIPKSQRRAIGKAASTATSNSGASKDADSVGHDGVWRTPPRLPGTIMRPPISTRTRGRGDPLPQGASSLCDNIDSGWKYECRGSNESLCYAFFGLPRKSCNEWCGDAGLTCIAGSDDNPKVSTPTSTCCNVHSTK